jgi:arginyl-tRNA synthetase
MDYNEKIAKILEKTLDKEINISLIESPKDNKLGDYAFPCFYLAKELKKNPIEIAKELANKIQPIDFISKVIATGPYVNFFIKKDNLASNVLIDIYDKKEDYGSGKKEKYTILVEGWQPNTHKAFHIGHIRNTLVGEALSRIFKKNGWNVIKSSYMGDIGAHVAKWIWYYKKFYNGDIPKKDVTKWAGKIYTDATKKIDENKEKYTEEIHEVHKKLEDGDKDLVNLWKKTRKLCLDDIWNIVHELGSFVERKFYESEAEQPGIAKVNEFLKKGYAKLSKGAIIMDLEEYKLGISVLLKSNGASLYATKDIALAYIKSKEYKFDKSLYIVANEQDHYFRQLFKVLELTNYPDADKLGHVSYGLVKLKDGKMSSRLGNIILYEDFRDQLFEKVESQIKERSLDTKTKQQIIKSVAFGAMKFTMLSQDSNKEIIFDYDRSLSFEGETGPYVQYTHARCASLLKKYDKEITSKVKFSLLIENEEKQIIKLLGKLPDTIKKSAEEYKPSLISRLLLDICQAFNEYYHKHQILQDNKELEKARILLIYCVKQVLEIGLDLLGIDAPDVM